MTNQSLRGPSDRGCLVSVVLTVALILSMLMIAAANPQPPTSAPTGTQVVANVTQAVTEEATVEVATEIAVVIEETPTPEPTIAPTTAPTATATMQVTEEATVAATEATDGAAVAMASAYDAELAEKGQSLFPLCAACHGSDGHGVPGLGKDLVDSEFVTSLTDDELAHFITVGRPSFDPANTTGIDMPPKGGNPALTEGDIDALVAYIRKLHADFMGVTAEAADETTVAAAETPASVQVADASTIDPELAAKGQSLFPLCAACHGSDGHGVLGLGKDLVDSEFVTSLTDDELVHFIIVGRPSFDPENTTGIDMPPKGGNPALTEDDIHAIVAYIRQLHQNAAGG